MNLSSNGWTRNAGEKKRQLYLHILDKNGNSILTIDFLNFFRGKQAGNPHWMFW